MNKFEPKHLEQFEGRQFVVLERFDGKDYQIEVGPNCPAHILNGSGIHSKDMVHLAHRMSQYIKVNVRLHCVIIGGEHSDHIESTFHAAVRMDVLVDGKWCTYPYERTDALFVLFDVPRVPIYGAKTCGDLTQAILICRPSTSQTNTDFTGEFNPADRQVDGFIAVPWWLTAGQAADAMPLTFEDETSVVLSNADVDFLKTVENVLTSEMINDVQSEYPAAGPITHVGMVRDYVTQDVQYLTKHVPSEQLKQTIDCLVNYRFNLHLQQASLLGF